MTAPGRRESVRVALGLGSNVGDGYAHFAAAIAGLRELGDVVAISSYFRTAPIGGPHQDPYLNAVVLLETTLPPADVHRATQALEVARGRERRERWGPRPLDIDILLYGNLEMATEHLVIPHPQMVKRRFVLEPLLEVWPDATMPDGEPLARRLALVADQSVERADRESAVPSWAAPLLFLFVGLAAVLIWWLGDWLL